ncbi:MAG: C69 family dipeptidase [Nitrososphaerales archaeon]
MCDTVVALPTATADGSVLFAKNSDREPNEAQAITFVPRCEYPANDSVRCTYVSIPQVRVTHAVLLSRPFWMWGAEMGANEHGVVMGNEAIFARVKPAKTGLTGMDLLRLGLERATTADAALQVITSLLETYGQGGSGGYRHPFYYHNSFLIADRAAAWVLETVGGEWAAQRVRDVASISNGLTIEGDFDLASPAVMIPRGAASLTYSFRRAYSDRLYTGFSRSHARQCLTEALLRGSGGATREGMFALLRSHARTDGYDPAHGSNADVCMHFGGGPIRVNQTTGSMVAHLRADGSATYWLTGTSAPCLSLFKPFSFDGFRRDGAADLFAALGPEPGAQDDGGASLWWLSEHLHRAVLHGYPARAAAFLPDLARLQSEFVGRTAEAERDGHVEAAHTSALLMKAQKAVADWTARVNRVAPARGPLSFYQRAWRSQNSSACLTL